MVSYEKKQIKNQLKSSTSNKLPSEGSISYDEKLTEKFDKQNPIIHISKKSVEINDNQKEMKKKIKFIMFIILLLLVLASLVYLIIYLKNKNKHKPEIPSTFNKVKLVIEKKYPINMLLRYSNKKETEMKLEGEKIWKNR